MFYRQVNQHLVLQLTTALEAPLLFALIDNNRDYLRRWLGWLDATQDIAAVESFIQNQLLVFAKGQGLLATIYWHGTLAGVVSFNRIDPTLATGWIGYWLAKPFTGQGIMTAAVKEMITLGFTELKLQKIVIQCAKGNEASQRLPQRLGFIHEGTLRHNENLYGQWVDHVIYGLRRSQDHEKSFFNSLLHNSA